jgi:hypothetical protein
MSDPLSIAASIGGLIALAGQLYSSIDNFLSNVKDAPIFARAIQAEIKSFRNSLHALQELFSSSTFGSNRRGSLISADYVLVAFTDAVLLFSELEAVITPLTPQTSDLALSAKVEWARMRERLNVLMERLQWQKQTLVLQLTILTW